MAGRFKEVSIQNDIGQTILTQKNELKENLISMNLSEYSEGVYVVSLLFEEGIVTIKGDNNETIDLHHLNCSISMITQKGYEPKPGDVICWKGFRNDSN